MDSRFKSSDSHPGVAFTSSYATVCEEGENGRVYSTFNSLNSLEQYLEENAVEAVRINQVEEPESNLLEVFDEKYAVKPTRTENVRAVLYGEEEAVLFGSEDILE
ncbi:hypothetical protein [Candidatus Nanohalobium constans]|uniref:Uncharacterized protein n=1 Tax=Candidatus Nanohalobium constans TaxID=2565781 RepID=A0A5Q0UEX5_9ARCH|nr:hypothetical protein [Candidatus Nanohalobium constans]QGA80096.1 hypothetical protein LC1Nh_0191 [Candidatus Nanohalobium constans]